MTDCLQAAVVSNEVEKIRKEKEEGKLGEKGPQSLMRNAAKKWNGGKYRSRETINARNVSNLNFSLSPPNR